MTKISVFIFSLIILVCSCTQSKESNKQTTNTYQKEGISINLPLYWKVKNDYFKEGNRYVEIDKYTNYKVESTIAISIFNKKLSADSLLSDQINQLKYFYQKVGFKVISKNKSTHIGKFDWITSNYEADDTKNKVYGEIGVTYYEDKTIILQIVEDKNNTDRSDFNVMFNTFIIK
ncbi:hypothetical protein [Apibacter mensalis]|uniref:hypothetical protein n=1 Tax=Apibacter mensalis TaxID=1586267 RepID=UPI0026E9F259|nr:hypothetical protein [Apibacter mensalis]